MTNRNTIWNELNELRSTLGNYNPQNIYSVPNGYFEGLPTHIMNRIKALEAANPKEELELLSPLLSGASKVMPYSVPAGFFQNFADSVMQKMNENADLQTSEEEIESLSPLLSNLKNKNPYSVPGGYFNNIETIIGKKEVKVISITKRKWYRLAVAASVIGIVVIGGLLFIKPSNSVDPNKDPQAWVEKNVINNKKIGTDKIDELVTLVNDENSKTENETTKQAEIKELLKDVPEKEIEDFLNDAVASNSNDEAETLMN